MTTVLHRLNRWAVEAPDEPAQQYRDGQSRDGPAWRTISARELRARVFELALFLESQGVGPGDVVAIFSYNTPEWVHTDLAAMLIGARSVGLYPNASASDIRFILEHTRATVLAVQNRDYFAKLPALPSCVKHLLVFEGDANLGPTAVSCAEALTRGRALAPGRTFDDLLARLDPASGAFLVYTSGTTGTPKGAVLSHDNLVHTADLAIASWRLPRGGVLFSFLPLCHIAEKLQNVGVGLTLRAVVRYCSRFENLAPELVEAQPTLLLAVPRVWEKIKAGVEAELERAPLVRRTLGRWALAVGARVAASRFAGRSPSALDRIRLALADRLVLAKVRRAIGMGRLAMGASGAAALPAHVATWFRALDIEICEVFGQTESTGVICMTTPGRDCAGTVGRPVPGLEVVLAEDREIRCRGRVIFLGYHGDEKATAETIVDGWLHTGDLGEWTPGGDLKIVGRKKEILKTSGGKMIAPLPIESRLKATPGISQVCLVGDGRHYLVALATLTEDAYASIGPAGRSPDGRTITDAATIARFDAQIAAVNASLARHEQVKRATLLARELSVEAGEMTPTLKIKRAVVEKNYRDVIDAMYAGD